MAKVYVFLADGFEDVEALIPVDVLRRGGVEVTTVSISDFPLVQSAHGVNIEADIMFEQGDFSDADLLLLPGGMPGASNLFAHKGVCKAVVDQFAASKKVAAICAAPAVVLGQLGLLEGRRATCYPGFEKQLEGASYTADLVTVDGNITTAEGPAAAFPFAYELLTQLKDQKTSDQIAEGMRFKHLMDYVIIVAGGKGLRMGSDIPKQFLPVGGRPVLMRTLERFREYSKELQIILVLPRAQQDYWRKLCHEFQFTVEYLLADGGETRFHSVQNGLALISDDAEGVVGVHDGVRPFPSIDVIRKCYETARTAKAVIPVIPVVETLRHTPPSTLIPPSSSKTVPRDEYRLVQTPQCFDIQLLKAANRQPYSDGFTDDASVAEAFGYHITLVEGNRENIKITTPFDLKIAEALI